MCALILFLATFPCKMGQCGGIVSPHDILCWVKSLLFCHTVLMKYLPACKDSYGYSPACPPTLTLTTSGYPTYIRYHLSSSMNIYRPFCWFSLTFPYCDATVTCLILYTEVNCSFVPITPSFTYKLRNLSPNNLQILTNKTAIGLCFPSDSLSDIQGNFSILVEDQPEEEIIPIASVFSLGLILDTVLFFHR